MAPVVKEHAIDRCLPLFFKVGVLRMRMFLDIGSVYKYIKLPPPPFPSPFSLTKKCAIFWQIW